MIVQERTLFERLADVSVGVLAVVGSAAMLPSRRAAIGQAGKARATRSRDIPRLEGLMTRVADLGDATRTPVVAVGFPPGVTVEGHARREQFVNAYTQVVANHPGVVWVTPGAVAQKTDREMLALLAHEKSHVVHKDQAVLNGIRVLLGALSLTPIFAAVPSAAPQLVHALTMTAGTGARLSALSALIPAGLACAVLQPVKVVTRAVFSGLWSRHSEFRADREAAHTTRDPTAVRINRELSQLEDAREAQTPAYSRGPAWLPERVRSVVEDLNRLYARITSSHPPEADRIAAIRLLEDELGTVPLMQRVPAGREMPKSGISAGQMTAERQFAGHNAHVEQQSSVTTPQTRERGL